MERFEPSLEGWFPMTWHPAGSVLSQNIPSPIAAFVKLNTGLIPAFVLLFLPTLLVGDSVVFFVFRGTTTATNIENRLLQVFDRLEKWRNPWTPQFKLYLKIPSPPTGCEYLWFSRARSLPSTSIFLPNKSLFLQTLHKNTWWTPVVWYVQPFVLK